MKTSRRQLLLFVAVVLLMGTVQAGASSYWERLEVGFPNELSFYTLRREIATPYVEIQLEIPQLIGLTNLEWQEQFNEKLNEIIEQFEAEIVGLATKVYEAEIDTVTMPYQGFARYEVKTNQGGLLSLALTYYTYTGGAHGMTYVDYLNLDLTTGKELTFADFFPTETEIQRAASVINATFAEDPGRFFDDEFSAEQFREEQGFYLADGNVVICFGLYELAAYVAGIQEFAVPAP